MIHGHVLVTGDQGYIGSVLAPMLLERGYRVIGLDAGFYADCLLDSANTTYVRHHADIRDVDAKVFDGVEAVIHLAALSNDALGEFNTSLTDEINRDATVRLARLAKSKGVRRFVFASSQSMYGVAATDSELDEDSGDKRPLTAYGRTKWEAECEIKKLADVDFTVVCFRPSTVFGVSPRLRCDVVYNNLVACAYTTGRIEIKSDGTPWRPVVHVRDVCAAFLAGLEAPASLVNGQSYNVGIRDGNFTVRQLAETAQRLVPGSTLVFTGEHNKDVRTYRVSFQRILSELQEFYRPQWDLQRGGQELIDFFQTVGFAEKHFRGRKCNRLDQLRFLQENKIIGPFLKYLSP
ncbi:MAG TPA: NAD(P)-dependent oxidoreductase [Gemmataceae bacterium]|nr:NAD(P)-dependent oxidoreductase [Gemmataceae bacterium]